MTHQQCEWDAGPTFNLSRRHYLVHARALSSDLDPDVTIYLSFESMIHWRWLCLGISNWWERESTWPGGGFSRWWLDQFLHGKGWDYWPDTFLAWRHWMSTLPQEEDTVQEWLYHGRTMQNINIWLFEIMHIELWWLYNIDFLCVQDKWLIDENMDKLRILWCSSPIKSQFWNYYTMCIHTLWQLLKYTSQ